jgi:cytochrome c biogenesis protein CcmG/thiol:disulfide interchange protein DsbE
MKTRESALFTGLPLLLLLILGMAACNHGTQTTVRREAPEFTLKNLEGRDVSLHEFGGKIVLLDFWATWCPPCRKSIPELVSLQNRYEDQGLVVIGISLDDPAKASDGFLRDFKKENRMNYPILRGGEGVVRDYFGDERIGIPTMFVINRDGEIVERHVGFVPGALEKSIRAVL